MIPDNVPALISIGCKASLKSALFWKLAKISMLLLILFIIYQMNLFHTVDELILLPLDPYHYDHEMTTPFSYDSVKIVQ